MVGDWGLDEEAKNVLDPEIARIAGASDHIVRQYTNGKTGETASVLIIYGPAAVVSFHTPEVCYPAVGFRPVASAPASIHDLKIPGLDKTAVYRQCFFDRTLAGRSEYAEAVYSFRYAGKWLPDAANEWKAFRFHPGMFKVQIGQAVTDFNTETSAGVKLLGEFMREIELRLAQTAKASASAAGRDQKAPAAQGVK